MHISLLLAHPRAASFNHAIAARALTVLENSGHQVAFHDLYAEGFDPVLPPSELPGADTAAVLPAAIASHQREIAAADGIIIVHHTCPK